MPVKTHVERNLRQAEGAGQAERAERLRAKLAEFASPPPPAVSAKDKKADLLEAAESAGLAVDPSFTKAELLEALESD